MGVKMLLWASWVMLVMGVVMAAPPTPEVNKRSAEDIQFGNQQNLPIGLLDDNALPGAFPSSETSEEFLEEKEAMKKEEMEPKKEEKENVEEKREEGENKEENTEVKEENVDERMRRNGGGSGSGGSMMDESRWHNSAVPSLRYYRPYWGVPRLYSPSSLPLHRRRRSPRLPPPLRPHRQQNRHRSLAGLRTLMRARGEAGEEDDQRREKREADLDELLKEVDVVELLNMLSHPRPKPAPAPAPVHLRPLYRPGFGTVRYAPAQPRFAPQPKLFPDYDDGEEGEGGNVGGMGLLKQNVIAAKQHLPEAIMMPAGGGRRVWRRSGGGATGGYGLSAVPGFKRSAFRANNPQPPQFQRLSPNDVYSLAAMLGAELDPVTHRLRRAAM